MTPATYRVIAEAIHDAYFEALKNAGVLSTALQEELWSKSCARAEAQTYEREANAPTY